MTQPHSKYFTYRTPHGPITIRATEKGIAEVVFEQVKLEGTCAASELTNQAATQLQEYLAGKRFYFDIALDVKGSAFQQAVWTEVSSIPYGQTATAADIAASLGKPGSHRSVGTAIKQNPVAPFIPTHRILTPGSTGKQAKLFRALQSLEQKS